MLTRAALAGLVVSIFAATAVSAAPFTAKDMAMLDRASDPHVSPDGRYVAWNVRSTDWNENKGTNALWVLDRSDKDASPHKLASEEKTAVSPRWSADGRKIYFLSS